MIPHLASKKDCTDCMACVASCKHGALKSRLHEDGHSYIDFQEDACVSCRACERVCPITNGFNYGEDSFSLTHPYKSWSNYREFRKRGTSGGVFASLAESILSRGE